MQMFYHLFIDSRVLFLFLQDKRAYLNDHLEASVEDHLELTWSSLADTRQELDNMKDLRQNFHQMHEDNQKLTESLADSREEVRNLTLEMKKLEMQNIQQRKWMEEAVGKMAREMKALEKKMVEFKATRNDEETGKRRVLIKPLNPPPRVCSDNLLVEPRRSCGGYAGTYVGNELPRGDRGTELKRGDRLTKLLKSL